jgi:hypothetical protein
MPLIVNNNTTLDIDGVDMPFSFSVADMKKPEKRKASASKTIKLPGTSTNLLFFQNVYNLSATDIANSSLAFSFDPRIRVEARYEENGITLFDGLLQILKAVKEDGHFTFEAVLFSNVINIVKELEQIDISELGWGEYEHTLGKTPIRNAWDTSVIKDGVATSNFTSGIPDGFGYIYSFADYGLEYVSGNERYQRTNQLKVGVYFREILQKAMQYVDKDYEFTLNDTELFKRITLFNEGGEEVQLTSAQIAEREVEKNDRLNRTEDIPLTSSDTGFFVTDTYYYKKFFFFPLSDWQLNTVTEDVNTVLTGLNNNGKIQINAQGYYSYALSGDVDITLFTSGGTSNNILEQNRSLKFVLLKNGSFLKNIDSFFFNEPSDTQPLTVSLDFSENFYFQEGDILEVRVVVNIDLTTSNQQNVQVGIGNGSDLQNTVVEALEKPLEDGDPIVISRFLPNMKVSDWYKSFMRMFNLYQLEEPDGSIKLIPAKDFYSGTTNAENWTQKLDHSMPIEIEPPNRIEGKFYNAKWVDEDDYWNMQYLKDTGERYGNNIFDVGNTWQQGTVDLEVGFAQTVPTQVVGTEVVMPRIYSQDDSGLIEPYEGNAPRIFIYNGMITIPSSDACAIHPSDATVWDPLFLVDGSDYVYPQFHHTLDLSDPKFDLNFKLPITIYYDGLFTTRNLWNEYWKTFIEEITSADAKILTAYFKLSKLDIKQLDFGKLKNIAGVVYRLNVVSDYISENNITTKCELIKVIKGDAPTFIGGIEFQDPDKNNGLINTPPDDDSSGTGIVNGGYKVEQTSKIIYG